MFRNRKQNYCDKKNILNDLIKIVEDTATGWENQFDRSIGPETLLGADLAFKSMDIVRLVAALQKFYRRNDLPFQDLFMPNGCPVRDLRVSDFADFLDIYIDNRSSLS